MKNQKPLHALLTGAPIGCLGGLIGLGGAEFRLPVLIGLFKYSAHQAVSLNLAVSLITLLSSLIFRIPSSPLAKLLPLLPVILALIAGGMGGAYIGALYTQKISEHALEKVILVLLLFIGLLLIGEFFYPLVTGGVQAPLPVLILIALAFGTGIGMVSSLLGIAGGELIIPTLIFVFGVDIKLAGTAGILISLPTVITGLGRHYAYGAFKQKKDFTELVLPMGIGSIIGAFIGGLLIFYVSGGLLKLILGVILIISAVKIFTKNQTSQQG
ncbi:Sulfite exporter TauE/SafE [Sporotomaculum syntrophicum]|uniref:Probable membrane transporter protein n=1 Tax=Sporotomaculum syntrophicum TaxID=182264 RepID=A0A9D3AVD1_9FIRM|nr:sulfite exporter TauE/SafE family protein [Sporotomaculum syntrophicum]KAF1083935.1 Sulfite exporter TauE/SafE [Sporotomaculum syntrophicum]